MVLRNEILNDYSVYCDQKLKSEFGQYSDVNNDPIYLYQRYKCRIIEERQRRVNTPSNLVIPDAHKRAYDNIVSDIENGNPLRKYQSRNLKNLNYDDDMLSHWGVQHLHLGEFIESDGFINRTGKLLFVYFTNESANIIGFFGHGVWCDLDLIEIMHANWPQELSVYKKYSDASKLTTDEYQALRSINGNANITVQDGTEYLCPGMGVTGNGAPVNAILNSDKVILNFNQEYELIVENIDKVLAADPEGRSSDTVTIGVELDQNSKEFVYIVKETSFRFTLAT
ncbi:hypothetical protein B5G52_09385 [Pseudoalteromonas sp. A601]|uniref:hypothetical protein n=1 Tax=Pseudoalteromonas sp. A601 TaxID=1967839 RepID=UPI000B3CD315|nr:hypothetical protein [Pseudoalteromonas sp. A601]OUS72056.1 hypothetical protein B5G52_09385 [Pseudoalteromonas sp. A601]